MKGILKLLVGLCLTITLTGCIAEDYDVGVPTAHLFLDEGPTSEQLTEANIRWKTSSEDVTQTIDDIQEFGLLQEEIKVSANEKAFLDFKENEENGGDIWTDPRITASLLKDGQRIELQMSDNREFRFPTNMGSYVLVVEFRSSAGNAQYVGNILIQ